MTMLENDGILRVASVAVTSPLDREKLRELVAMSTIAAIAEIGGQVAGFLLGLERGCSYDNGKTVSMQALSLDRLPPAGTQAKA